MKRIAQWGLAVALLAVVLTSGGCGGTDGPSLAKAGGSVTLDGAPVAGATVTMVFDNGNVSVGVTGADGKFSMTTGGREGALIGKAKVTVTKVTGGADVQVSAGPTKPEDMAKMMAGQMGNVKSQADVKKPTNELPEKYAQTESSGLSADIPAGGVQDLSFALTK